MIISPVQSLKQSFSTIEDPRDPRGLKHNLTETLCLIVIGFLFGKNDFTNIEHVLKLNEKKLKRYFALENGIPSHDTMNRIMHIIDEDEMIFAVCDWFSMLINSKKKHLIIDGKGIRAAAAKNKNQKTPYIMNVLEAGSRMVLMQLKVGEKTNEINGIKELLTYVDLDGRIVTIDAIGTQWAIMDQIIGKGGHFVLQLKKNQETLFNDVELHMETLINSPYAEDKMKLETREDEANNDHGRYEKREYCVTHDSSCVLIENFIGKINTICRVKRETVKYIYDDEGNVIDEQKSIEISYYVSDLIMDVNEMSQYIREHWLIEDSLHWVLDNTFREDRSTIKGNGMVNTAMMRKIAYNIIRLYHLHENIDTTFEYAIDELKYNIEKLMHYILDEIEIAY